MPSIQNFTPSPKNFDILPDSELVHVNYNTMQIHLSPKQKRISIIHDEDNTNPILIDNTIITINIIKDTS